jgi:uncharacterized protein (DUF111 family)
MARIRTGKPNGRPPSPLQDRESTDMVMKNVPSDVIEKIDRLRQSNESRKDVIMRIIRMQSEVSVPHQQVDTDWVTVIESHIDNMSGELLGSLMECLFAAGALDVSYTPIQMKKNRPATLVTVISPPQDGERLALVLLRETSTLGVRIQQVQRRKAQRAQELMATPLGLVLVKVKRLGSRIVGATPEYEECQRIARERDVPLVDVYEVVQRAIQITLESQR